MAERKYYVLCASNCKYEGMKKEQILTAIKNAVETGEIKDVDTGFVTTIKEQNKGLGLTFWVGTTAEFNAITKKVDGCYYIITDDTTIPDIENAIEEMREFAAGVEQLAKKTKNEAVCRQGDTMQGALILQGAPTADNEAATKAYAEHAANTAIKYYEKIAVVPENYTDFVEVFTIPNFDAKKQMILLFYSYTLAGIELPTNCVGQVVFDDDDTTKQIMINYSGNVAPDPTVRFTYDGKVLYKGNSSKWNNMPIKFAVVPIEKEAE